MAALAAACSIYDAEVPGRQPDGGSSAGAAGTSVAGGGATGGNGGSTGNGGTGTGGTSGEDGGTGDAEGVDADATLTDVVSPPPDALRDVASDALETGLPGDGGPSDSVPPADASTAADAWDASTGPDSPDTGPPPSDGSIDAPATPDADATAARDADSGPRDAPDGGPTGPQILPLHGTAIEKPDAGAPFDSRCASDEVVTGFVGRAGVQTDALASTCSKLIAGVLSSPRNLPLNGNLTGGSPVTVICAANYVAVGIVGRYGHSTMWMEDVTTTVGVVCKDLASATTQIVTVTGQPALDAGYTSFREDCTGGRYLTDISGRPDSNSLSYTVGQVGGECDVR